MAEEREEEKEEEREGERKPPSKDVGADKKTTTGKIVAWLMEYKVYILAGLVLAGLAAWLAMRNKAASTQTQTTQPGYTAPTTTSAGTSSGGSSAGGGGGGGVLGAIEALGASQQAANAANLASLQAANTANQAANETMLQKIQQEIAALHQHATQRISRRISSGGTSGGNPITALQSVVIKGMSTVTAQHLQGMTLAQSPALTQIHNTVQSARETLAAAGQPFASTYNSPYVQNLLHGQTGNTISSSLASQIAAAGGGAQVGSSLILSTPKGLQKLAIESQPLPATAVAATHINHVPAQVAATKVAAMPYHAPVQVLRVHQLQGGL